MKTLAILMVVVATTSYAVCAQGLEAPETLSQGQDDINYGRLLNAVQLTKDQLLALLEMQVTWQAENALTPDIAGLPPENPCSGC